MFGKSFLSGSNYASSARGRGGVYPSPGMAELVGCLESHEEGRVLDLGPADEVTLSFLGGKRVEVQIADLEPEAGGRILIPEFPEAAFAAVLGWDLLFRLAEDARGQLADAMIRWLAPGGALYLVLPLSETGASWGFRFRVHGPSEVEYRPCRSLSTGSVPTNREVLALFPSLECTGARILRHGAREFVLRSPPEEEAATEAAGTGQSF